jgi:hypothetical protein
LYRPYALACAAVAIALTAVLVLVVFAGVLGLLALACEEKRREYALAYVEKFVNLAARFVAYSSAYSYAARPMPMA